MTTEDTTTTSSTVTKPSSRPHMKVLRICPDGRADLVEIPAHRDAVADAVEGRDPYDVRARATWRMHGGDYVTVWTANHAGDDNQLAQRIALQFVPEPVPGVPPRDRRDVARQRIQETPLSGVVVVTGYVRGAAMCSLGDTAWGAIRALIDGRAAARAEAHDRQAATVTLTVPKTTTLPAAAG